MVYKNLIVHPQVVTKAHYAGCAAAKQGKFLEFRHNWWDKAYLPYTQGDQSKMSEDNIFKIAQDLHVDMDKFKKDMNSDECANHVKADMAELSKFRVNATPSFFVNGTHVGGALPKESFKSLIDQKLKEVEASGVACDQFYDKKVMGEGEKQFKSRGGKPG